MPRTMAGRMTRSSEAAVAALEIVTAKPGEADSFWRASDRDWRSELWNFRVVWHEQTHDFLARDDDRIVAALRVRIAASLAHVDALYVLPGYRLRGLARTLLARCEELANYYNCHKVSAAVFAGHPAQAFFECCGYKLEAILAQHTFKLDVAMLRKFLL
jgi:GNAT superfamily N-acetyltransferase